MGVGSQHVGERSDGSEQPSGVAHRGDADTDGRRPALTGIADVYRRPTAQPLATLATTLVLVALAWQTYLVTVTRGPGLGLLVLVTLVFAYWLATRYWAVQNAYIASVLARHDLDEADDTDATVTDG